MASGNLKSFSKFKLKISVFCCDKYYVAKLSLYLEGFFPPIQYFSLLRSLTCFTKFEIQILLAVCSS